MADDMFKEDPEEEFEEEYYSVRFYFGDYGRKKLWEKNIKKK